MLPFLFESIASSQEFGNWFVYVTLIITKLKAGQESYLEMCLN